jgi:signal transduction histidine kinase
MMKKYVRPISYFLSILTLAIIFFGIEFIIEKFFFSNDEIVDIIAAIAGALSFAPCQRFFDRMTDRIFFRGPRDVHAELIANVSHELQTPIAILRGNVELLQRGSTTDTERASAERVIVTTLDGMSRLIGNVLESAKLTFSASNKKIIAPQAVAVERLLQETSEDCLLLAEDKGVGLLVEAEEYIFVSADRDRLKEVLLNLISNALKHTPRGGVISLRAEHAGAAARIVVKDSGCGISPESLPHIFERFYQIRNNTFAFADNASTPPAPSNGIGLNICRQIIEAHGGKITAESEVGKGSQFIIRLPLAPP